MDCLCRVVLQSLKQDARLQLAITVTSKVLKPTAPTTRWHLAEREGMPQVLYGGKPLKLAHVSKSLRDGSPSSAQSFTISFPFTKGSFRGHAVGLPDLVPNTLRYTCAHLRMFGGCHGEQGDLRR